MKENVFVIDSKGEYLRDHYEELINKGYNVNIINLREPTTGEGWNPLEYPYKVYLSDKDKAQDILESIGNILFKSENESDPFWTDMCINLFSGLSLYLFKKGNLKYINLYNIYHFIDDKDMFKKVFTTSCDDETILNYVNPIVLAPSETQGGILSVFRQKLGLYVNRENLNNLLMETTFDMDKDSNAIVVLTNDEKEPLNILTKILSNEILDNTNNKYSCINNMNKDIPLKPIKEANIFKLDLEEYIK